MRRTLQQHAKCWLSTIATIGVALETVLAQRFVPTLEQHDRQVCHGCKHQCMLPSSIGTCEVLQNCATIAQQEEGVHDAHDEQMQQRDVRRQRGIHQHTARELARPCTAPRQSALTDIADREKIFAGGL